MTGGKRVLEATTLGEKMLKIGAKAVSTVSFERNALFALLTVKQRLVLVPTRANRT